jgi:hypothetical protein
MLFRFSKKEVPLRAICEAMEFTPVKAFYAIVLLNLIIAFSAALWRAVWGGDTPFVSDLANAFVLFACICLAFVYTQFLGSTFVLFSLNTLGSFLLDFWLMIDFENIHFFLLSLSASVKVSNFFFPTIFSETLTFCTIVFWLIYACCGIAKILRSTPSNRFARVLRLCGLTPDLVHILASTVPHLWGFFHGVIDLQVFILLSVCVGALWGSFVIFADLIYTVQYRGMTVIAALCVTASITFFTFVLIIRRIKFRRHSALTKFKSFIKAFTAVRILCAVDSPLSVATSFLEIFALYDDIHQEFIEKIFVKVFGLSPSGGLVDALQSIQLCSDNSDPKVFSTIENIFEDRKKFKGSIFYAKVAQAGKYMMLLGLTSMMERDVHDYVFGENAIEGVKSQMKHQSLDDVMFDVAETAHYFLKTGYQMYFGKTFRDILVSADPVMNFFSEYQDLMDSLDQISSKSGDMRDLSQRVQALMVVGRSLKAGSSTGAVLQCMRDLKAKEHLLRIRLATGGVRKKPFAILIHGESGIGKSTIIDMLFQFYHSTSQAAGFNEDIAWDPNTDKYTRTFVDKFWSRYDFQWAILMDDLAYENRYNVGSTPNNSVQELIAVINNVTFSTPQAEAMDKGTKPLMARCVIGTTNVKHLNSKFVFNYPSALLRRLPIVITPSVKPEFRKGDSNMLNDNDFMIDAWTFKVETVYPVGPQALYKTEKEACSLQELQEWLKPMILAHERSQSMVVANNSKPLPMCEHGWFAHTCSTCAELRQMSKEDVQIKDVVLTGLTFPCSHTPMGKWCDQCSLDGTRDCDTCSYDSLDRRFAEDVEESLSGASCDSCGESVYGCECPGTRCWACGLLDGQCQCPPWKCERCNLPPAQCCCMPFIDELPLVESLFLFWLDWFLGFIQIFCGVFGFDGGRITMRLWIFICKTRITMVRNHKAVKTVGAVLILFMGSWMFKKYLVGKREKAEPKEEFEQPSPNEHEATIFPVALAERRDPWAKDTSQFFAFLGANKSISTSDLQSLVEQNTFNIVVYHAKEKEAMRALGIAKKWLAVPAHAFLGSKVLTVWY